MKVITFAHQKGGVGKSTILVNIAHSLILKGYRVAVKDMDNQGTTMTCLKSIDLFNMPDFIDEKKYDFLLIDTPPYLNPILVDLFVESDLVLIPTKPSIPDVVAINGTVALFNKAKSRNADLKGRILINQNNSGSSIFQQLEEELNSLSIDIFDTFIENRIVYCRTINEENGIFSDTDKKAHLEINKLTDEILILLK